MIYFYLNGLKVSKICLGTVFFGTVIEESKAFSIIDEYISLGGNILDTAHCYADWLTYGKSTSEKFIGKWLKNNNNKNIIISTKGGHPNLNSINIPHLSYKELSNDINESLDYLGVNTIDIYWLHRDNVNIPVGELIDILDEFKNKGMCKHIGVSNWSVDRIEKANEYAEKHNKAKIETSQIMFSSASPNTKNLDKTLKIMDSIEYKYYKKSKMPVFCYSSQANGYFSKKSLGLLDENTINLYENEISDNNYKIIKEISNTTGKTIGQTALNLIVQNEDFNCVAIIGSNKLEYLKESMNCITDIKSDFKFFNN